MARLYAALVYEDREPKERIFWNRIDVFSLHDDTFMQTFRLSKAVVRYVCGELREDLQPLSDVTTALSVESQVLCALMFFGSGSFQWVVGQDRFVNLSQPSVSRSVHKVVNAIERRMFKRDISFPYPNEYPLLKQKFMQASGFPGVIGAIDCTHIKLIAPPEPADANYIDRRGDYSLNVQLICDSDMKILSINSKHAGRNHDAFIWRHSRIRSITETEHLSRTLQNGWLIAICVSFDEVTYLNGTTVNKYSLMKPMQAGDSGYPLEPWLMTPILQPRGNAENRYNKAHARARNVIERVNGLLKSRFRCLHKLNLEPTVASKITNACAVLHNLCILFRVPFDDENDYNSDDDDDENATQPHSRGAVVRNDIIQNYFS